MRKNSGIKTYWTTANFYSREELAKVFKTRNLSYFTVYEFIRENEGCTEQDLKDALNTDKRFIFNGHVLYELRMQGIVNEKYEPTLGYIYVIHDGYQNFKVGMTNNYTTRIRMYKTYIPYMEVVKVKRVYFYEEYEQMIHEVFKEKRISGEWFKLNESDIDWV